MAIASPESGDLRRDHSWVRDAIIVALMVVAVFVARPLGTAGQGLLTGLLLAANIAATSFRLADARFPTRVPFLVVAILSVIIGGCLVAVETTGVSLIFPYALAGTVGYRLRTSTATAVAIGCSVSTTLGLLIGTAAGWTNVAIFAGVFTGLPVLIGQANRSRTLALLAAQREAAALADAADARAIEHATAERARIARDVHDVLAHSLAGVGMQLELTQAYADAGDHHKARAAAARAQNLVREAQSEVAATVSALRATTLPLLPTIESIIASAAPPGTALQVSGEPFEVRAEVSGVLIRVVQESLTNVLRHAPGAKTRVAVEFDSPTVTVAITNAGATLPQSARPSSGMGVIGIHERVAAVGGQVQIGPDSQVPGGWSVWVRVPK